MREKGGKRGEMENTSAESLAAHADGYRDRGTERQRHRQIDTETETQRDKDVDIGRARQRQRQIDTETEAQRDEHTAHSMDSTPHVRSTRARTHTHTNLGTRLKLGARFSASVAGLSVLPSLVPVWEVMGARMGTASKGCHYMYMFSVSLKSRQFYVLSGTMRVPY